MTRFTLVFSLFLVSSNQVFALDFVKDCTGTSDDGDSVELTISPSTSDDPALAPLQGYFEADVLVDGKTVYSTPYIAFNPENNEYFTAGNSNLVLSAAPDYQFYLHVLNPDGSVTVPSFDTISVTCR